MRVFTLRSANLRWLPRLAVCLIGIAATLAPSTLCAQTAARGSRNLPVDHWAYEYVQRLRTRGLLENLNPLVRPYRRGDVAEGLAVVDADTLTEPLAGWVRLLQAEFWRELDRLAERDVGFWGIPVQGSLVASTGQRLDVLRPVGSEEIWPRASGGVWLEQGPFAAEARATFDAQLEDDPEGPIDQGRGRADNSYLSLGFSFADVWFGRLKQNWSALGTRGLMISDVAPAYPELSFEVRVGPFALRSLTGELDALPVSGPDRQKRYISAHRFEFRSPHVVLALSEATLFATTTGFQFRFLNPLEGTFIQAVNRQDGAPREDDENSVVEFQGWVGVRGIELYLDFLVDDIDIDPGPEGAEPFTYAFTAGTRLAGIAPWLELGLEYSQVSAFAYRGPQGVDLWTFVDQGLGENFSDFDRLTLTAAIFLPGVPGLQLTPTFQFQRQGEGNLRDPVPPRAIHVASPALFLGVKETTVRFGLQGRFQPNRFIHVTWDVGQNVIDNAGNVQGSDVNDFTAVATAGFTLDFPIRR